MKKKKRDEVREFMIAMRKLMIRHGTPYLTWQEMKEAYRNYREDGSDGTH